MNQKFLVQALENQNSDNYEESVKNIEKIYKNFHSLGTIADQLPFTRNIIRENREILSQAHLDDFNNLCPKSIPVHEYDKNQMNMNRKPKQTKIKWSDKEQKLFNEAIELYGMKSKLKILTNRFKKSS